MNEAMPRGENVESPELWKQLRAGAPAQGDALIAKLGEMDNSKKVIALDTLFNELVADNKNRFIGDYISLEREELIEDEKIAESEARKVKIREAKERMRIAA